jgi:hypothetical protein
MAPAPGHRLGQIIGDMLELAVAPPLVRLASEHDLYLDRIGPRATRSGAKVKWEDDLGNTHDLDYVLERGGTDNDLGIPAAFIETAWRRYTKHSKAKAQEIEGAILPILAKWSHVKPFAGVILAGEFTPSSLQQLRSNGFTLLHIPAQRIIEVFAKVNIDVDSDESTSDRHVQEQIDLYTGLSEAQRNVLGRALRTVARQEIKNFINDLEIAILRRIRNVSILPLHGTTNSIKSVEAATELLVDYRPPTKPGALVRFEVVVHYDNDDRIVADFASAADAIAFLESFR